MTVEERIDSALDKVLRAAGTKLENYTLPGTLAAMRAAMREIMIESYTAGSNDNFRAMKRGAGRW